MNFITISNRKNEQGSNIEFFGKYINIELNYSLDHWNNYFDTESNAHFFVLGRPTIEVDEWDNYDDKPSYITKIIAKSYKRYNFNIFCQKLNGGFSLVIADYDRQTLFMISDKFGVYPIYFNQTLNLDDLQISTHQDILAKYVDDVTLDEISVSEFLSQGYIMHPNTYYNEIKSLGNAAYIKCNFKDGSIDVKSYFNFKFKQNFNYKDILYKLVNALKIAVERRTVPHLGKTGVLLSGGGDSRMIACNSISNIETYSVYDVINNEIKTAQRVSEKLGLKHHLIKRPPNCNKDGLMFAPKYTAGMAIGSNGTFLNLTTEPLMNNLDNILTGDYADWLLKDISFNTKKKKILGKELPINKFSSFNYNFYGPNIEFEKLLTDIERRRKERFDDVQLKPQKLQFRRILPLSNEFTCDSRLTLQRALPWDTIFIDNDILNVLLEMPDEFKLNGKLYNDALGILCKKTREIPHSNTGVRIGTSIEFSILLRAVKSLKKKLFPKKEKSSLYGDDSWGNAKEFISGDVDLLEQFYSLPSNFKELINSHLGFDIFSYSIDEILDIDYHLFNNIMTIYYWLKESENLDKLINS